MPCQFELLSPEPDADGKWTIFCPNCTQHIRRTKPSVKTYRECVAPPDNEFGVGSKMKEILVTFDIRPTATCKCREYMLIMNQLGVEGCKKESKVIVGWLKKEHDKWGWGAKLRHYAVIGLKVDFPVNWRRPFESFLEEAIRRAEDQLQCQSLATHHP